VKRPSLAAILFASCKSPDSAAVEHPTGASLWIDNSAAWPSGTGTQSRTASMSGVLDFLQAVPRCAFACRAPEENVCGFAEGARLWIARTNLWVGV